MTTSPDRNTGGRSNPYRILGISGDRVGPFGLLGVSPERCERADVIKALRGQLARVDAHRDRHSLEADELRRKLRHAAHLLLDPATLETLRHQYLAAREKALHQPQYRRAELHHALAAGQLGTKRPAFPSAFPTRTPPPAAIAAAPAGAPAPADPHKPDPRMGVGRHNQLLIDSEVRAQLRLALMTGGGWNRRTKSKAVAIAASHGLSPGHLSTELIAVATELSTGQMRRLAPVSPGPTADPAAAPPELSRPPAASAAADPQPDRSDDDNDDVYSDIVAQRNLLVAAVTFFLGLMLTIPFGLWVMSEIRDASQAGRNLRAGHGAAAPLVEGSEAGASNDPLGDATRRKSPSSAADTKRETLPPTQPLPLTLSQAIDQLDDEFRSATGLPDGLLSRFDGILMQARAAWTQYDSSSRTRVQRFVLDVMCDKGEDGNVAAALIERIAPDPIRPWSVDSVPEFAWSAGLLGMLMGDEALPDPARQQTELRWERCTGKATGSDRSNGPMDFTQAAGYGLHLVAADLMLRMRAGSVDDERVLVWNAWIQTNKALHQQTEAIGQVMVETAYALLRDGPEPGANETAHRVLIALLSEADVVGTPLVRTEIARWFGDPQVSPSDLNLVTSYLVSSQRIAGLETTHIVDVSANSSERAQFREQLLAAWPTTDSEQSNVGPAISDWLVRAERALLRSAGDDVPELQLAEVLQVAHLNEAAAWLELGHSELSDAVLSDSRRVIASAGAQALVRSGRRTRGGAQQGTTPAGGAAERPPISFGEDGRWTILIEQALRRNDRQRAIDLIQWLGMQAADARAGAPDLGPIDAAKLTNLAVYGLNRVVRAEALTVLESQFADGYTVILALADAIPPDRKDSALNHTIEQILGSALPSAGTPDWYVQCRAGLLAHALELRGPTVTAARIDGLALFLGYCYEARSTASAQWTAIGYGLPINGSPSLLRASTSPRSHAVSVPPESLSTRRNQPAPPASTGLESAGPGAAAAGSDVQQSPRSKDPATWAAACRNSWLLRARRLSPTRPVPADLDTIQARQDARLQLAEDPISAFAAQQYGLLELMVYVTAAERPAASASLTEILNAALRDRSQADSVMQQLMIVEQAITQVWKIRLLQSNPRGGGGNA